MGDRPILEPFRSSWNRQSINQSRAIAGPWFCDQTTFRVPLCLQSPYSLNKEAPTSAKSQGQGNGLAMARRPVGLVPHLRCSSRNAAKVSAKHSQVRKQTTNSRPASTNPKTLKPSRASAGPWFCDPPPVRVTLSLPSPHSLIREALASAKSQGQGNGPAMARRACGP